jgi:hypothetical protein
MENFDEYSFEHLLNMGWYLTPEDIYKEKENGLQIENEDKKAEIEAEEKEITIETATYNDLIKLARKYNVKYARVSKKDLKTAIQKALSDDDES